MDVGMLWFDKEADVGVMDKVGKAAEYYLKKYGKKPNVCYVNPKLLDEDNMQIDQILIRPSLTIQPNYFWIGVRRKIRRKRKSDLGI